MSKSRKKTLKEVLTRKPKSAKTSHKATLKKLLDLAKDGSKEKKKSARGVSTKKPKNKTLRNLLELVGKKRPTLVIHYRTDDDLARETASYIVEGGKPVVFDNRYSARKDRAHVPGQKEHVHVMLRGKDMCVLNLDGTPSHHSDINQIPKHLHPRLRRMGVIVGEAYLIVEAADLAEVIAILLENIQSIEKQ
jgi:hypothetical protein